MSQQTPDDDEYDYDDTMYSADDIDYEYEDDEIEVIEDATVDEVVYDDVEQAARAEIRDAITAMREKDFEVLRPEDIASRQQREIDKISEVLGVTPANARIILRVYGWKSEKVLNVFFSDDGQAKVFKAAGLQDPDTAQKAAEAFTCPGCYDDTDTNNATSLGCGHGFCNDCWKTYIEMKIQEGQSRKITCMGFKCTAMIDETIVAKFADKTMLDKYEQNVIESFVEDNENVKWCPSAPHCGAAVISNINPKLPMEVDCTCGHKFCFRCLRVPHLPATCEMVTLWSKKCADDSETFNWINANTKDCPKCKKAIEKNGGCNHMTCPCGFHFCWVCGDHFDHTTYKHSCSRYDSSGTGNKDESRRSLERYLHYFQRFNAHAESIKLEGKTRANVNTKVDQIYKLKPNSAWIEVQWLANGLETLFSARHAMQYSYAFAYYMFDESIQKNQKAEVLAGCKRFNPRQLKIQQNLFEDFQEQLENTTEKLSELVEKPVDKLCFDENIKKEIMSYTVLVDRRLAGLFDVIQKELMEPGEFYIPRGLLPQASRVTSATAHDLFNAVVPPQPTSNSSSRVDKGKGKGKATAGEASVSAAIGDYFDGELTDEMIAKLTADSGTTASQSEEDAELQRAIQQSLMHR